jgi:hypothetical protein
MADVTFDSMNLEDQTIDLQRFNRLALHHAIECDPKDQADVSRLCHVTELLTDRVDQLVDWLEKNGKSNVRNKAA